MVPRLRPHGRPWRWAGNPTPVVAFVCTAVLAAGVVFALENAPLPTKQIPDTGAVGNPARERRIREGSEIVDQLGSFRMTGDRVTFFTADGQGRYVALENLNLERIARVVTEQSDRLTWSVTGTMTEYRGANYLFVRRAILKSRIDPQSAAAF